MSLAYQLSFAPGPILRRKQKAESPVFPRPSAFLTGTHETIRTSDLPLRRRLLYPTELHGHIVIAPAFYPKFLRLSTTWLFFGRLCCHDVPCLYTLTFVFHFFIAAPCTFPYTSHLHPTYKYDILFPAQTGQCFTNLTGLLHFYYIRSPSLDTGRGSIV